MRIVIACTFIFLLFSAGAASQQVTVETYNEYLESIQIRRQSFATQYASACTNAQRDTIINAAQLFLYTQITTSLFGYWYGTPWDFYGMTQTPQQGKIACGYFVMQILYDAGLKIPRKIWAQLASEVFIKKLSADIKRFSNVSVDKVESYIRSRPDGLYIVGLDCHTGFIYKAGKEVSFVHASYYLPHIGVLKENLAGENPFNDSKYRVIGRVLEPAMVRNWILGIKY